MRAIEKRFYSLIYLKIRKCVPTQKKMKKKSWIFLFSIKKVYYLCIVILKTIFLP